MELENPSCEDSHTDPTIMVHNGRSSADDPGVLKNTNTENGVVVLVKTGGYDPLLTKNASVNNWSNSESANTIEKVNLSPDHLSTTMPPMSCEQRSIRRSSCTRVRAAQRPTAELVQQLATKEEISSRTTCTVQSSNREHRRFDLQVSSAAVHVPRSRRGVKKQQPTRHVQQTVSPCRSPAPDWAGVARSSSRRRSFGWDISVSTPCRGCVKEGTMVSVPMGAALQDHIAAIEEYRRTTIAMWSERVATAEQYRDKPTRAGGRPAALRPQDRGFLERVRRGLAAFTAQLVDTEAGLNAEAIPHDMDQLAFSSYGLTTPQKRRHSVQVGQRREYFVHAAVRIRNLLLDAHAMQQRVDNLFAVPAEYEPYDPMGEHHCNRAGSTSPRCSHSRDSSQPVARIRAKNIKGDARCLTMPSPHPLWTLTAENDRGGVRRGGKVIQPGGKAPQSPSPASMPWPASTCLLNSPMTVVRQPLSQAVQRSSPNAIRPALTPSSPCRSSESPSMVTGGDVKAANGALTLFDSKDTTGEMSEVTLATYSSPRGQMVNASVSPPDLSETRRLELLLEIQRLEQGMMQLQKSDSMRAQELFAELYGAVHGRQQYHTWVDELTLKAIRRRY